MAIRQFVIGAIGALFAASSVQAQEITITNLVDPQEEMAACMSALSGESFADEMCSRSLNYLNQLTPKIENAHYDLLLSLNDNTERYDSVVEGRHKVGYYKKYLADSNRVNIKNIENLEINYQILSRNFDFIKTGSNYYFGQTLMVSEFVRSTTKIEGELLSDTLFKHVKHVGRRLDCSRTSKVRKCQKELQDTDKNSRNNIHTGRYHLDGYWSDQRIYIGDHYSGPNELLIQSLAAEYMSHPAA